ncbi:MAG: hypothetical protein ACD_3C00143G0006 [uncultured bacterium (gcode 4)]|uniref:Uncharacterized protein n=1 Tax=uncultured bacterium (gcode 4) TaxID=1234023 RepID=K2GC73_9BACT|nr:MAG: hypothetical protein ACD_3C00143G0006 [uncultured bacterium (gcode 4)]
MRILVCAAHPNEMKSIKSSLKSLEIFDANIDFLQLWMGSYETIHNLTKYLEKNKPDFLVNIWICWQRGDYGELIQIWRIINSADKELLVPIVFEYAKISSIICLESMARILDDLRWEDYADMESYGVEFIASKYQIPRLILKLPADKIWQGFDKSLLKTSADKLSHIDYKDLMGRIINFDKAQFKPKDNTYIQQAYRFTFQEFEIMKFKINKYEALTKKDFKNFYELNKYLTKIDFLQELEKIFSFDS